MNFNLNRFPQPFNDPSNAGCQRQIHNSAAIEDEPWTGKHMLPDHEHDSLAPYPLGSRRPWCDHDEIWLFHFSSPGTLKKLTAQSEQPCELFKHNGWYPTRYRPCDQLPIAKNQPPPNMAIESITPSIAWRLPSNCGVRTKIKIHTST